VSAPLRVGITGGIGSGKSAVTGILEQFGTVVVDADIAAREVVAPGTQALDAIALQFGAEILQSDGSLDRGALRRIVFAEPAQRRWLEALTHPLIGALIASQLSAAESPYVVLSSPLLLEGSQIDMVDYVVVVDVPEELQLQRTTARDDNSEALVRSIMTAQLPRAQRLQKADRIVDNSGSLLELERRTVNLHQQLLSLAASDSAVRHNS
jgi:dephospho-CoA kinase